MTRTQADSDWDCYCRASFEKFCVVASIIGREKDEYEVELKLIGFEQIKRRNRG